MIGQYAETRREEQTVFAWSCTGGKGGGCFSEPSGFKRSNSVLCDFDVFPAAHQPTRCDARVSVACISASLICIQAIAAAPSTVICGYGRDFDGLAGVISTSLICVQAHSLWRTPTRLSDLTAYHTYWYVTVRVYFGRFLSTLDNVPQLSDSVPRLFLRHWLLFRCTLAYWTSVYLPVCHSQMWVMDVLSGRFSVSTAERYDYPTACRNYMHILLRPSARLPIFGTCLSACHSYLCVIDVRFKSTLADLQSTTVFWTASKTLLFKSYLY